MKTLIIDDVDMGLSVEVLYHIDLLDRPRVQSMTNLISGVDTYHDPNIDHYIWAVFQHHLEQKD